MKGLKNVYLLVEVKLSERFGECVTTSRVKTHEKKFWVQLLVKRYKMGPEIRFVMTFSSLGL